MKTEVTFNSWRSIEKDFRPPALDSTFSCGFLMVKLAPAYYRKLNLALVGTERYCELPAWRKDFKIAWEKKRNKNLSHFPLLTVMKNTAPSSSMGLHLSTIHRQPFLHLQTPCPSCSSSSPSFLP